ncbi:MAG: HAD family phosphatase [Rikenellaceae bacterium]
MLKGIKNIIFDLGGVLVDLDRDRCVRSFTEIGFAQAEKLIDFYYPAAFFNDLERGAIGVEEVCDIIREQAGVYISNEDICMAYSNFLVGIPVEKLRLIKSLRDRGYRIYALSNINPIVMPKVYEFFKSDGLSVEDYFDKMYLSYEMKCVKPHREIFDKLILDSGVDVKETLFLDDGLKNVEMGREVGFAVYMPEARESFSHLFDE